MVWFYLALAAVFEVIFAMSMKYADGFTNLKASVVTVIAVIAGIGFLTLALRDLPVSVAYPSRLSDLDGSWDVGDRRIGLRVSGRKLDDDESTFSARHCIGCCRIKDVGRIKKRPPPEQTEAGVI